MKKSTKYWKERFAQLEESQYRKAQSILKDFENAYVQAQKTLDAQIATWYQRFADNNQISLADAKKYLTAAELKEFKWDVKEYIKYGEENAINERWMKELENASAKFHISRLEALKLQTKNTLETLCNTNLGDMTEGLKDIYESGYYHSIFNIQQGFGIGFDVSALDKSRVDKVIKKPWAVDGKNFSTRIWGNKDKLVNTIHQELTQNIMLGKDPQKAIDSIAKKMNTSKNTAGRLVMTEEAYFSSLSQKDAFNDLDVEEYEIVATLDSHTSEICQDLDGEVFKMTDYSAGETAPPFHVYCRSTTAPHFDDDFDLVGKRVARDENGQIYEVPADMTYHKWKDSFVDGGSKSGLKPTDSGDIIKTITDEHLKVLAETLENLGVEHNPVEMHKTPLSEEEIINVLSGGDKTSGSCASVGLAYVGQKAGMNVLDFRGGASQDFFSTYLNLKEITKFPGIEPIFETAKASLTVGNKLLKKVVQGKEYYLCVGEHCAIVRKNADGVLQYLELQSPTRSGWTDFNGNPRFTLSSRFGCKNGVGNTEEGFMIDVEQFEESDELQTLLGYINTASDEQKKGVTGHVR